MIINCSLFVKRYFPNPCSAKDFPCYKNEHDKARNMPLRIYKFDKYISIIICIMGDKYESFEIGHKIEAVESTTKDDIGRQTAIVMNVLQSKMRERMNGLGMDIAGHAINYKFYKDSYMISEVRQAIRYLLTQPQKIPTHMDLH